MASRIITLILLLFSSSSFAGLFDSPGKQDFVPVDRAFAFDFQQQGNQLKLNWQIKPGYYLYRQQISVTPQHATLAALTLPKGQWHEDEFYGKTEIYTQALRLPVTLITVQADASLSVTYQGCAEAGFCYPPETRIIPLNTNIASTPVTEHTTSAPQPQSVQDVISTSTQTQNTKLPFSALWAFLIGIGIAFTPCVLPMYPLISGIVLGGKQRFSTTRALVLTFMYVQGMAITYTILGMIVAAAGMQFQAALQHPYVLVGLSILFILLATSMFGLFTLQLPSSLQTRLALVSNRQRSGSMGGVFAMGALAGLICSPCTTAPLSAILLYIAQSGNLWSGGGTLYLYALGMGLPLMLITVFGNHLLPKSGPWMASVKTAFGFVILALPVFLLERVLGETWGIRLWSLLGTTFFIWTFLTLVHVRKSGIRLVQIILLGAALISIRPLQDWLFNPPIKTSPSHLNFNQIADTQQLNQALMNARGKTVMLDLYADWCVACKEFEKYTFSDKQVQNSLAGSMLLQVDLTQNNAQDIRLMKHLNVLGLPTILFFDEQGKEIAGARITGFMDAKTFHAHLQKYIR